MDKLTVTLFKQQGRSQQVIEVVDLSLDPFALERTTRSWVSTNYVDPVAVEDFINPATSVPGFPDGNPATNVPVFPNGNPQAVSQGSTIGFPNGNPQAVTQGSTQVSPNTISPNPATNVPVFPNGNPQAVAQGSTQVSPNTISPNPPTSAVTNPTTNPAQISLSPVTIRRLTVPIGRTGDWIELKVTNAESELLEVVARSAEEIGAQVQTLAQVTPEETQRLSALIQDAIMQAYPQYAERKRAEGNER